MVSSIQKTAFGFPGAVFFISRDGVYAAGAQDARSGDLCGEYAMPPGYGYYWQYRTITTGAGLQEVI